jgi:ParB family chromosome partitioning protein
MAQAAKKIVLSSSRDIPFNKLVLSQANVRRVKAGIAIEDLAEDIARRTLLQSLNVRPIIGDDGEATGMFEVPAGGRRYRALDLLVKQRRLAKTALVPCVVREGGIAEEDSLAENVQRVALHPLDQFRAFQALREKGLDDEEIAARFFVSVQVVRQRLKLASVSPKLLDLYAEDGITLEQLMAFTLVADPARQEQVWEALARSPYKEAYQIRRMLTEGAVRASDKRVRFLGIEVYEGAGGLVGRDLFQADDGGWLEDPALLDRLVSEKLAAEAATIAAEGWKWVSAAISLPYGHTNGLRRLASTSSLSEEEQATRDALTMEYAQIEERYSNTAEDLPEEVDRRLGEIEAALEAFESRPPVFKANEIARAGAFVSLDASGALEVERGYIRPEDEAAVELVTPVGDPERELEPGSADGSVQRAVITVGGSTTSSSDEQEEDGVKPLAERLMTELTAHRTLALRNAVASNPDAAYLAVLHALCLKAFYPFSSETCVEIEGKHSGFGHQVPGLNDTASAKAIQQRQDAWAERLPREPKALWETLVAFDIATRQALFAHCVSQSVNAVHQSWNQAGRMSHADRLAEAVALDMVGAGWVPTIENYLGRVTKARILLAVREAKGEREAELIEHLKKADMAKEAERLLAGTGWLPEPLRTGVSMEGSINDGHSAVAPGGEDLPGFLAEDAEALGPNAAVEPSADPLAAE